MALQQTLVGTRNFLSIPENPPIKHRLSSSLPFSKTIPALHSRKNKRLGFICYPRCSMDYNDHHERVMYPRPAEIPWKKELANSVQLIGIVGTPVQIKHLTSGKVLAWTRLGVKKSASDTIWINLTFWDELAHVASQHLEKGNRVYVSGRLLSDTVEGDDEKRQTFYKVVVQQLNFIESNFSPVTLYERETNSTMTEGKVDNYVRNNTVSTEALWQAFFANPLDWWDNRRNKRNPKYPDFKHKDTGEALWIEAKYNPQWVKSQLAILDSRMESLRAHEAGNFMAADDFSPF